MGRIFREPSYRRFGRLALLYQKFAAAYGKDDPNVLVIKAPTVTLNPTISRAIIEQAEQDDPTAALSEWQAEFRSDIAAFLDDASIDAAIDYSRPLELPPRPGISYVAFVDPSGGRHDAFTLGIAHAEDGRVILDVIRGRKPPFDPNAVVQEYTGLVKEYGITRITGDNYSAVWVEAAFRDAGLTYERADKPKGQLYLESLPLFARQAVSIPEHPQLIRELRLLERRTHRSGRDTVDHGPSGSDDFANALCGALYLAAGKRSTYDASLAWVGVPSPREWQRIEFGNFVISGGRRW